MTILKFIGLTGISISPLLLTNPQILQIVMNVLGDIPKYFYSLASDPAIGLFYFGIAIGIDACLIVGPILIWAGSIYLWIKDVVDWFRNL